MVRSLHARRRRIVGLAGAVAAAAASLVLGSGGAAVADSVPFADSNAVGYIGFCDAHNHQVRSGDIGAAPFAVKAVASVPAPSGFPAGTGRSVLLVYQPIQNVDATDWSGKQLTAASSYTNTSYPMAQGIGRDPALVDFTSVFPPRWDGLVQFRMYYTSPTLPQHSAPYPATVVKVSGNTWTQVSGGNVPCSAGSATSVETIALPKSLLTQTARSTPGAPAQSSAKPGAKDASSSTGNVAPASNAGNSTPTATKSSSSTGWVLPVVLIAVVAAAAALVVVLRRRRSLVSPPK